MAIWNRKNGQESEHRFMLSRKLLGKMLISCIIVTMLPLLLCNIQYHKEIQRAREEEEQHIAQYLHQRKTRYDEALRELDKVMLSVMSDSELLAVSITESPLKDGSSLYSFLQAQKRISQIAQYYDILDNLILFNARKNFAIAANASYLKMELFAPAMEKRYRGFSWPENLLKDLLSKNVDRQQWRYIPSNTGDEVVAVYVNAMSLTKGEHIILCVMTPGKLRDYLHIDSDTDVLVYNEENQRLSGSPMYDVREEDLLAATDSGVIMGADGKKYLVKIQNSDTVKHRLYAVTPYERIESGIISLKHMNQLYFSIVIFCTLTLCALATWINMKPLDGMLRFLFGREGINVSRTLNWKMIDARIHEIFRKNDELTTNLHTQRESLLNHLFYELTCNTSVSGFVSERILRRMERLNVSVQGNYSLLVLELPRPGSDMDLAALSLLMHQCIRYRIPGVLALQDVTSRRYIVLCRDANWEELAAGYELFFSDVQTALQLDARGCGCMVASLQELNQLYWDAVMTLEVQMEETSGLIPLTEEYDSPIALQYPQRIEQEIVTAMISGNQEMLEVSLNELYDMNNEEWMMSGVSARLLWERVSATVAVTLMRMKNVPEILQLKTILSLRHTVETESRYDFTHKIIASLDSIFILTRKESSTRLHRSESGKRIVDYIQLHLSDPDLCLQMVADHFGLSSAYISSLVKDETGQSFSIYCERLRIANACEMLREGKQIQMVAEAVGYSSAHTFRRVFKKVVGILPSQYAGQ